jgi:serine/threonine protein kinase
MAGKKLSYHLLGHFTSGGVADLYSAVLSDGHRVLIRSLQATKVLSVHSHLRFRYGVKIREALTPHPNIIGSLEWGYHGLQPYEIIEWFDGHNIKNHITSRTEQLYRDLVYILSEAAEGLAWIHASGFMHLDVKPENFLLRLSPTARPVVKLTDFDLVRRANDCGPRRQVGTPAYMAPEQFVRKISTPASDVFAFSVMGYQLATGRMPFAGKSEKDMWRHQASESVQARPIYELNPETPGQLADAIMAGLEKRLDRRPPTMKEWLEILRAH